MTKVYAVYVAATDGGRDVLVALYADEEVARAAAGERFDAYYMSMEVRA